MTRINSLCHQREAARSIIQEQFDRMGRIDAEISSLAGITFAGGFARAETEDFEVEVLRHSGSHPQVIAREKMVGGGMACAEV